MNAPPALRARTLLCPTDGTPLSAPALRQAAAYSARLGATLHLLAVHPFAGADTVALPPDVPAPPAVVRQTVDAETPEQGILAYARAIDADLIVMRTHARQGLDRWIDGSVTEEVVRRAPCPVLVLGPTTALVRDPLRRILAPTDFSEASYLACAHAAALARLHGAGLDLVHVVAPLVEPGLLGTRAGWANANPAEVNAAYEALDAFADDLALEGVDVACHALEAAPALGILETARLVGSDLLVVGSHGRTGFQRLMLGSVAETLLRTAGCPVLVVNARSKSLLHQAPLIAQAESPGATP